MKTTTKAVSALEALEQFIEEYTIIPDPQPKQPESWIGPAKEESKTKKTKRKSPPQEEYKPYWEKLKDPRWQRKRLEIMERDDFQCRKCRSRDKTLNVHHRYYSKGKSPWEYDDAIFVTLCEPCHEEAERHKNIVLSQMGSNTRRDSDLVMIAQALACTSGEITFWGWAAENLGNCILRAAMLATEPNSDSYNAGDLVDLIQKDMAECIANLHRAFFNIDEKYNK